MGRESDEEIGGGEREKPIRKHELVGGVDVQRVSANQYTGHTVRRIRPRSTKHLPR